MKLFQFKKGAAQFVELRDFGALRPFPEISLLAQILECTAELPKNMPTDEPMWLVFSEQEEAQVAVLSKQAVGGLRIDQGLGHGMSGSELFLTSLLSHTGLYLSPFAANKDPRKPVTDKEGWLLALQGIG